MPIETAADRAVFVATTDFGVAGTYRRCDTGVVSPIAGIFDAASGAVEVGASQAVETALPQLVVREADLPEGATEDDEVTFTAAEMGAAGIPVRHAGTYRVALISPDGTGMATLFMERRADDQDSR